MSEVRRPLRRNCSSAVSHTARRQYFSNPLHGEDELLYRVCSELRILGQRQRPLQGACLFENVRRAQAVTQASFVLLVDVAGGVPLALI